MPDYSGQRGQSRKKQKNPKIPIVTCSASRGRQEGAQLTGQSIRHNFRDGKQCEGR